EPQRERRAHGEDLVGLGTDHLVGAPELSAGGGRGFGQTLGGRHGPVGHVAGDAPGGGGEVRVAAVGAGARRGRGRGAGHWADTSRMELTASTVRASAAQPALARAGPGCRHMTAADCKRAVICVEGRGGGRKVRTTRFVRPAGPPATTTGGSDMGYEDTKADVKETM